MSKNLFSILASLIISALFTFSAFAQDAAETGETLSLDAQALNNESIMATFNKENNATPNTEVIAKASPIVTTSVAEKQAETAKTKQQVKVEKFLKSKVGQWVIKKTSIKAHKKQVRKQLRELKGDKEARKTLKEKSKNEVVEIKSINSNVRTGIILVAVGIILTILPVDIIRIIGSILIVVGLVFIILGLV
jgi:hypothetical protein